MRLQDPPLTPPRRGTGIERPKFLVTPLAEGLAWRGDGIHRFEEKMDGQTHTLEVTGRPSSVAGAGGLLRRVEGYTALLWGELVQPSTFYAVDCLEYNGENLRPWPRRESLKVLDRLTALVARPATEDGPNIPLPILRPAVGHGGEFLEAVLARGGEGVVASLLDEPFAAPRWKCKRVETFIVTVLEKHPGGKSSVRVGTATGTVEGTITGGTPAPLAASTLQHFNASTPDLGWLPLFGRKFDQVRVGSVLKVEGYGLTLHGKIREPRVCKDTATSWLVKY